MLFIFSTPVFIRHLWQLQIVIFLHWCLKSTVLLTIGRQSSGNVGESSVVRGFERDGEVEGQARQAGRFRQVLRHQPYQASKPAQRSQGPGEQGPNAIKTFLPSRIETRHNGSFTIAKFSGKTVSDSYTQQSLLYLSLPPWVTRHR
jgi:hypothetical protein